MAAISSLRNLGPASETALNRIGIMTAEELIAIGADDAYARLIANGERPHFIGFYVLHMALQGRPWNDCKGAEKEALRVKFDAVKSTAGGKGDSAIEAFMREFGLIEIKAR